MSRDQKRWKDWADNLRQTMMTQRVPEVVKTVSEISHETGTDRANSTLASERFWKSCVLGEGTYGVLCKAGFELSYTPTDEGKVEAVTFQLNSTWQNILQRVLDR
jgi:hypothetical protein